MEHRPGGGGRWWLWRWTWLLATAALAVAFWLLVSGWPLAAWPVALRTTLALYLLLVLVALLPPGTELRWNPLGVVCFVVISQTVAIFGAELFGLRARWFRMALGIALGLPFLVLFSRGARRGVGAKP